MMLEGGGHPAGKTAQGLGCVPSLTPDNSGGATTFNPESWAFHCRQGEHEKCSMVCACPHHDEPRGTMTWAGMSTVERGPRLIEGES